VRQARPRWGGARIDPDHVTPFVRRVGDELDRLLIGGLRGRRRQVDAIALDVELPAVEGATQAAFLVAAVIETGAAVRTMRLDDANPPVGRTESQQILAQDLDLLRWPVPLRPLFGEHRPHPETPQQLTPRR